jgi:transposase
MWQRIFFAQTPRATVVMEACGSAHHWGRQLQAQGHEVVLLPPHQVRPYVTRNKTDRTDAKGILEACHNSDPRPVPVKSIPQQVLGSIHRFRASWISSRSVEAYEALPSRPRGKQPSCREAGGLLRGRSTESGIAAGQDWAR